MRVRAAAIALSVLVLAGCDGGEPSAPAPDATRSGPRPGEAQLPAGGLPPGRILFLDKPFGIDELLRLIQIALTGAPGDQSGS